MYYLAKGTIKTYMNMDYTLNYIKEKYNWHTANALNSPYPKEVYSWFVKESRYLKDLISYFVTENEKICNLPFYFLLHNNEIIACAAQQIIDGRLQPIEINWYI